MSIEFCSRLWLRISALAEREVAAHVIQGLPGGARLGFFNATNVKTQCNVSPAWHPAIHDHGLEVGPAVTF
jgi:hypothetical protein